QVNCPRGGPPKYSGISSRQDVPDAPKPWLIFSDRQNFGCKRPRFELTNEEHAIPGQLTSQERRPQLSKRRGQFSRTMNSCNPNRLANGHSFLRHFPTIVKIGDWLRRSADVSVLIFHIVAAE